jgi:hypothetical protein
MESETWRDHPVLFLHQKEAWTTTKLWMTVASFAKQTKMCLSAHFSWTVQKRLIHFRPKMGKSQEQRPLSSPRMSFSQ